MEQEKIKSENGNKVKKNQSKTGLIVNEGEFQEGIWLFLQY